MTRSWYVGLADLLALGAASAVATAVLVAVPVAPAGAADPTCVGKAEYDQIHSGMTIAKLVRVLDGQAPLLDAPMHGHQNVRWYAACDGWDAVNDVMVRYHEAVVGRRTVLNKKLAVYVPVG